MDEALNLPESLWCGLKIGNAFPALKYNQANLNENAIQEIMANSILCSIVSLSQEVKICIFW